LRDLRSTAQQQRHRSKQRQPPPDRNPMWYQKLSKEGAMFDDAQPLATSRSERNRSAGIVPIVVLFWAGLAISVVEVATAQQISRASPLVPPVASAMNRQPEYPAHVRAKRIEGDVVVSFDVLENGSVVDAEIRSGPDELRKAVLDAVLSWRFQPAHRGAVRIRTRQTKTIRFRIGRDFAIGRGQ
jgi:TonB family protein